MAVRPDLRGDRLLASQGLRAPAPGERLPVRASYTRLNVADVPTRQMLKMPLFWLLFPMMTMMSTSG